MLPSSLALSPASGDWCLKYFSISASDRLVALAPLPVPSRVGVGGSSSFASPDDSERSCIGVINPEESLSDCSNKAMLYSMPRQAEGPPVKGGG